MHPTIADGVVLDYYRILDCYYGCDYSHIKTAYRRKVKASHPDYGGGEADFIRLKEAYDVLSDPRRRMAYDSQLGLRFFKGRYYRTTIPSAIETPTKDVYDDIKELLSKKFHGLHNTTVILYIDENNIVVNADGTVLFAVEMEFICPSCLGFGGFLGGCGICKGEGKVYEEVLIPYPLKGKMGEKAPLRFKYEGLKIELEFI